MISTENMGHICSIIVLLSENWLFLLQTEDLEKIEMTGRVNNKPSALLQVALQPQIASSYFSRNSNVRIQKIKTETKKINLSVKRQDEPKVSFGLLNNIVYYNEDGIFDSSTGTSTQGQKMLRIFSMALSKLLKLLPKKMKIQKMRLKIRMAQLKI